MRKFLCLALVLILALSAAACSKDETPVDQNGDNNSQPPVTAPPDDSNSDEQTPPPADDDNQPDDEKPSDKPEDEHEQGESNGPVEILSLMGKNLDDVKDTLGEEKSSYVDEFDGNTVHSFGDIELGTDAEGKIVSVLLIRDNQISDSKYTFKGMNFRNTNAEMLDILGNPINGSNYTFVYSDDFAQWLKIDFDENGYPAMVTIFHAADQGDRNFTWE